MKICIRPDVFNSHMKENKSVCFSFAKPPWTINALFTLSITEMNLNHHNSESKAHGKDWVIFLEYSELCTSFLFLIPQSPLALQEVVFMAAGVFQNTIVWEVMSCWNTMAATDTKKATPKVLRSHALCVYRAILVRWKNIKSREATRKKKRAGRNNKVLLLHTNKIKNRSWERKWKSGIYSTQMNGWISFINMISHLAGHNGGRN